MSREAKVAKKSKSRASKRSKQANRKNGPKSSSKSKRVKAPKAKYSNFKQSKASKRAAAGNSADEGAADTEESGDQQAKYGFTTYASIALVGIAIIVLILYFVLGPEAGSENRASAARQRSKREPSLRGLDPTKDCGKRLTEWKFRLGEYLQGSLRVFDGQDMEMSQAPWTVAFGWWCTGSIINERWVLSAAHCAKWVTYTLAMAIFLAYRKLFDYSSYHQEAG